MPALVRAVIRAKSNLPNKILMLGHSVSNQPGWGTQPPQISFIIFLWIEDWKTSTPTNFEACKNFISKDRIFQSFQRISAKMGTATQQNSLINLKRYYKHMQNLFTYVTFHSESKILLF